MGKAFLVRKGGSNVKLFTFTAKANDIYDAPEGEAWNRVIVNVPAGEADPVLQEKTATENGEVVADEGYDGLSKVVVNVPEVEVKVDPVLQDKTATENGTVVADEGYDGLSKVVVNVASKELKLQEKTALHFGEVTPDAGYDGLSKVRVAVQEHYQVHKRSVGDTFLIAHEANDVVEISDPTVITYTDLGSDYEFTAKKAGECKIVVKSELNVIRSAWCFLIDLIVAETLTTALDFTNYNNGSFTETLSDGSTVTHTVTLTDGIPTSVDDITIEGLG